MRAAAQLLATLGPAFVIALASAGCPDAETVVEHRTAAEQGEVLFSDPALAGATQNRLSCNHCHDPASPYQPGGSLAGVTKRPSYWGAQETTLLRAVNDCLYFFMAADAPWTGEEDDAIAIYAYLESLEGGADAAPFTIPAVVDPGEGDAGRGEGVYAGACAPCHGEKSTAEGRLLPNAPILPEETLANHPSPDYTDEDRRLVFVEKTRHGGFLGYGGQMPLFSAEVLSDVDMADLLAYLGVPKP